MRPLSNEIMSAFAASVLTICLISSAALAGQGIPKPEACRLLHLIKNDEKCCTACFKPKGQPKVCQTFCSKDSDDKCDDFEDGEYKPKLKDAPCYSICKNQCEKTLGNLTLKECITDCLNRTRC